jgi:hypothetical protein
MANSGTFLVSSKYLEDSLKFLSNVS